MTLNYIYFEKICVNVMFGPITCTQHPLTNLHHTHLQISNIQVHNNGASEVKPLSSGWCENQKFGGTS